MTVFDRDGAVLEVRYQHEVIRIELWWPGARVYYGNRSGAGEIHQQFRAYPEERVYAMGQRTRGRLNHKGLALDLVQRNVEVSIPFILSGRGYGFLWNPAVGRVEFADNATRWTATQARAIDHYIAIAGIPWWTTDIGGFHGGDGPDDAFRELIVRWFQYGAFCPLFRLHGNREPRTATGWDQTGGPNEVCAFGWSGREYAGGGPVEEAAPLSEIPAYVRDGANVPLTGNDH